MYGGAWDLLEAAPAGQTAAQGPSDPDEFATLCQEFPGVSSVEGLKDQRAQLVQLISAQRKAGANAKPLELRLSRLDYFMTLLDARQQQQQQQQQQAAEIKAAAREPQ